MKGKNILKEGKIPKDRRTGRISNNKLGCVSGTNYAASFGEALYRTSYGRGHTAKIEMLDGSNYAATYNGITREWCGDFDKIPDGCKKAVEGYYA